MANNDTASMALFCDFENIALGVRDAQYEKFDIRPVLERLLAKGSIVVKKAYCDWDRYKGFKAAMHEANFELIEIPHVRQSGKNSADIRMVVDALDLCYTKSHVDTFVIISGDSDFSPLVSKLRENAKRVIGVGVKQSCSDLLITNCDEFIYYDDLVRDREGQRGQGLSPPASDPPWPAMKRPCLPSRWCATLVTVALVAALQGCGGGDGFTPATAAGPASTTASSTLPPVDDPASRRLLEPPPDAERVVSGPGQLVSATRINTLAAADITAAVQGHDKMPTAHPVYSVTSYRLNYVTRDGRGNEVVASGLVSVPLKEPGSRSPLLGYQHATIFKDAQAPSNNVVPSEPTVILASLGFIVIAADYVGFGAAKAAQHPYLLSEPSAAAVTAYRDRGLAAREQHGRGG